MCVGSTRSEWQWLTVSSFSKINKPTESDAAYIYNLVFDHWFPSMEDWKLNEEMRKWKGNFSYAVQNRKEKYLWRLSTISERIFWKFPDPVDFRPKLNDTWIWTQHHIFRFSHFVSFHFELQCTENNPLSHTRCHLGSELSAFFNQSELSYVCRFLTF